MRLVIAALIALSAVASATAQGLGQQATVAILDRDRLLRETDLGRDLQADLQQRASEIEEQAAQVSAQLEEEELEMVELRATMPAAEFAVLAEAFDQKVNAIRQEQITIARDLNTQINNLGQVFFERATPILAAYLSENGVDLVLDKNSILYSSAKLDITDKAIEYLNQNYKN